MFKPTVTRLKAALVTDSRRSKDGMVGAYGADAQSPKRITANSGSQTLGVNTQRNGKGGSPSVKQVVRKLSGASAAQTNQAGRTTGSGSSNLPASRGNANMKGVD